MLDAYTIYHRKTNDLLTRLLHYTRETQDMNLAAEFDEISRGLNGGNGA